MALPAYSPKIGVISGAEESLSQLATDPLKAPYALPLLFGAQAVRQDANASYDANNQFSRQLAQQIQDQTAAHQVRSDRNTALNINNPGGTAIAAMSPDSGIDLNDPVVSRLIQAMTGGQFGAQAAKTFQDYGSGYKSFVEGGATPSTQSMVSSTGIPMADTGPLSLRVENVRQQGANARALAQQLTDKEPRVVSKFTPGTDGQPGKVVYESAPVPLSIAGQMGDIITQLNSRTPLKVYSGGSEPTQQPAPTLKYQTSKGSSGAVVGKPTTNMGAALPPAPQTGGTKTTSAPATPAPGATAAPSPTREAVTADTTINGTQRQGYVNQYVNLVQSSPKVDDATKQKVRDAAVRGTITIGVGRSGQKYIVVDGVNTGARVD